MLPFLNLANRLGVTRQAVSRWESEQSYRETEKIIKIAEIFEVSLDYLMRDEVISKAERNRISRVQNISLAVSIINILTFLGLTTAVVVSYLTNDYLWGILILSIFSSGYHYCLYDCSQKWDKEWIVFA